MADALSLRESVDLVRSYHTRVVRPFEKLGEVLAIAQQMIDHDLPAARQELDDLTTRRDHLRASIPDVEAELAKARARVEAADGEARSAEQAAADRISHADRLADARETELVRAFEHKGATLERDFTARRDAVTLEITQLDTTKARLIDEVAALREKFSKF